MVVFWRGKVKPPSASVIFCSSTPSMITVAPSSGCPKTSFTTPLWTGGLLHPPATIPSRHHALRIASPQTSRAHGRPGARPEQGSARRCRGEAANPGSAFTPQYRRPPSVSFDVADGTPGATLVALRHRWETDDRG